MDTIRPSVDDASKRPGADLPGAHPSIYERPAAPASVPKADGIVFRGVTGAVAGIGLSFILSELGMPHIAGLGKYHVFLPLAGAGLVLGMTRFRRVLVWFTAALTIPLGVVGYTDVMRGPVQRLIRSDPVPASADAIVVLSAGVTPDGMLNQQSIDRLLKGLELSRAGIAPRLILTTERRRIGEAYIQATEDQARVVAIGGQPEVLATGLVASTREEALRVAQVARRDGWQRVVLVTSPLHSRRACATFEKAGLNVSCIPADSRDVALRSLGGPDSRVRAFGLWIYELAGTLRYRVARWI